MTYSEKVTVADRQLTIETGKLATQAHSSITIRYGDTIVLITTCIGEERLEESDFIRLTVDYEERHYAVGKIPGSFIRREGRPSEQATLTARLTDRSLRPLLPKGLKNDIQIVITVLSTDQENTPDILAVIGASASLCQSSIPFNGPVGAVRIGCINDNLIVNPTLQQLTDSVIDVVVASTREAIVMVEADGKEVSEELVLKAIELGHEVNQHILQSQEKLQQHGGQQKIEVKTTESNAELVAAISSEYGEKLTNALTMPNRDERKEKISSVAQEITDKLKDTYPEEEIGIGIEEQLKKAARRYILNNKKHIDGRQYNEIRSLSCEVGILPRTHGSGLFTRGQTQVLSITTLGSLRQEQLIDGLGLEETKRFMHHYNFPPFSTGEVKRIGTTSRREIGHGALAERALEQVIPTEDDFSYTIRVVSEVLSSNGSTSMASICSSSLSLMDAGVPIKAPVAGIAMGLVTDDSNYVVLTDIEGLEDAYGDMDFKVAGTAEGITAIQLDIKLQGISLQILSDAIYQARKAHSIILDTMKTAIASSRPELSQYAPRIFRLKIDPSKIGAVIGTAGKTIRSIIDETKASIDIENDGTVLITSPSEESANKAIEAIDNLTREVVVGEIYTGKVSRITNFGAFVEILPNKEGLVHISELADYHVSRVEDIVKIDDEITVKVTDIDNYGRINLSRRAVLGESSQEEGSKATSTFSKDRSYQKPKPRRDSYPRSTKPNRFGTHNRK